MAYKIRTISKKEELARPDEFVSTFDRLSEMVRVNTGAVLFGAAAVVLLGVAAGGYFWYEGKRRDAASQIEIEALNLYHSEDSAPGESDTPQPSREDNLKKAVEKYTEVLTHYPGTPSAVMSRYYIGNSYLELGEYDQAVTAYKAFLEELPKDPGLRGLALARLGTAYVEKGDRAAAADAFDQVVSDDQSLNRDQALLELGRIHEAEDKKDQAIEEYQRILREFPLSLTVTDARERLKALGATVPEESADKAEAEPTTVTPVSP